MITLKKVTKQFKNLTVLDTVSLRISPGEFVCITGPSGAGKSTLLALLVGALDVTSGSISVDDVDLRTVPSGALQLFRQRVGMVFQDHKLLRNRTVAENIAFPLEVVGAPDAVIENRVAALLQRMGLTERARAMPAELSGSERTRVAIARAIVHKPMILLADEPTRNLDPQQAADVIHLFREIHAEGATVIFATHDPAIVESLHTRVIALDHGRVVRDGIGSHASVESAKNDILVGALHKASTAIIVEAEMTMVMQPEKPTVDAVAKQPAKPAQKASPQARKLSSSKKKRRGPLRRRGDEYMFETGVTHGEPEPGQRKVRITSIHSE